MKDRKDISNEVNNTRMAVSSTDNKSSSNIWFRIEYTCENDLCQ
jgi:hypothetical protein